jgi:hypothetical protein
LVRTEQATIEGNLIDDAHVSHGHHGVVDLEATYSTETALIDSEPTVFLGVSMLDYRWNDMHVFNWWWLKIIWREIEILSLCDTNR